MMHPQQGWLRAGFLIPLFAFCSLFLSACQPAPEAYRFSGLIMGTSYNVTVVDLPSGLELAAVKQGVQAALVAVDAEMSTYKPASGLMQLNAHPVNDARDISAELMQVLQLSKRVYQASQGAFDPTVGALVNAWGFGPREVKADELPSDEEIARLLSSLGYDKLKLSPEQGSATRQSDVFVDLSAVAKGYGVDRAAEWLLARGVANFLVEVGGELRAHGYSPRGDRWVTAITDPDSGVPPSIHRRLVVDGQAVATSGDYYNFFTVDSVRYSHTIDPRTGRPVTHSLASVTVVADSCAEADAFATAIDVLGPEQGLAMAEREGLAVYILARGEDGFTATYSPAFERYLADTVR
jgi:thiamine biosynthesis lipoprotein